MYIYIYIYIYIHVLIVIGASGDRPPSSSCSQLCSYFLDKANNSKARQDKSSTAALMKPEYASSTCSSLIVCAQYVRVPWDPQFADEASMSGWIGRARQAPTMQTHLTVAVIMMRLHRCMPMRTALPSICVFRMSHAYNHIISYDMKLHHIIIYTFVPRLRGAPFRSPARSVFVAPYLRGPAREVGAGK